MPNKKKKKSFLQSRLLVMGVGAVIVLALLLVFLSKPTPQKQMIEEYNPEINPSDFTTSITNRYFSLTPGDVLTYENKGADSTEKVEISITGETKEIMGVKTLVYHDKVWVDEVVVEDTIDYLAQDEEGNVWYFGEEVNNYKNGVLSDHHGSWLAGVDGAKPGLWFKANPKVGDNYRQEYYKGQAEDMAQVEAIDETVTTPFGTFTECVKTLDTTPLEPNSRENKYYCPEIKNMVLSIDLEDNERLELINKKISR